MKLISLILLLFLSVQLNALPRFFKKLDKLYKEDIHLCWKEALKLEKEHPDSPVVQFFLVKILYDKTESAMTVRAKFLHTKRMLYHTNKLNEIESDKFKRKVSWNQCLIRVYNRCQEILEILYHFNKKKEIEMIEKSVSKILVKPKKIRVKKD